MLLTRVDYSVVQGIGIGVGISKGLFNFQNIDKRDSLVVETVPLSILEGLYIGIVVTVVCSAIMDQNCV